MNLQKKFETLISKIRILGRVRGAKISNKAHFAQLKKHNIPHKKLSQKQKRAVDAVFKNRYHCKYSYATHELYYSVTGRFNPYIIPEDLFRTQIELKMNDNTYKKVFSDKLYFDRFLPSAKFPVTVIRNIDGLLYDNCYNPISYEQALEITKNYEHLVFKPTRESGCGRGVHLVDLKNENPLSDENKNYILQEKIVQHPDLAQLNDSSVNIVRVMTWLNKNEVTILSPALRVGGNGSFVDNQISSDGKGMTVTGLSKDGICNNLTCYSCGVLTDKSASGVVLDGYKIPELPQMLEKAKEQHLQLPQFKFIAWDFTVNDKNEVVTVEYNIKCPGILYYQYVNGPLFAEQTTEFLDNYLRKRKN